MNIVLNILLGLYLGGSVYLLSTVKDEIDRNYALNHPFGGLMIFLFGPIVAAGIVSVPRFRREILQARAASKMKGM